MRYIEPHFQSLPALSGRPVKQVAGVDNISLVIHEDFSTYPASFARAIEGGRRLFEGAGDVGGSSQCWVSPKRVCCSSIVSIAFALRFES